ncbi:cytochrome P450 [uncultured Jatrophihabitans sp.]|uniref:cytochrome P450 n=1 Tax=uncultured Jatrophihabitans sp. TaxID=1610747 RepID=UPI0035CC301A
MPVSIEELAGPDAPAALARLRADGPVTWVPAVGGWLVTGYDQASTVMRAPASFTVDDPRFSTAQVVGASMLSVDGAEHRRHRTPFVAPFRPARVQQAFGASVRGVAAGLVERIRPAGRAELRSELAGPMSVAVIAEVLGLHAVDAATVLAWYGAIVAGVTSLSAGIEPDRAAATAMANLADHIALGLGRGSVLAAARADLPEPDVIANAAVMMFGGIETTEGMITNLALHLLTHPDVLGRLRADERLIGAAVEESLRLEPAAAVVDRYATADTELGGVTVRRGDLVRVSITGANRDPSVFDDPDRFRLGRPNVRSQLSFARGPHVCIAMDLARLETSAAIAAVLGLPDLELESATPATGLIFRKPASLVARWEIGQPGPPS